MTVVVCAMSRGCCALRWRGAEAVMRPLAERACVAIRRALRAGIAKPERTTACPFVAGLRAVAILRSTACPFVAGQRAVAIAQRQRLDSIVLRSSAALSSLGAFRCVSPLRGSSRRCESGDLPCCVGRVVSAGVWPLLCAGPRPCHFCAGHSLYSGPALSCELRACPYL